MKKITLLVSLTLVFALITCNKESSTPKITTYTVTFNTDGGTDITPITVPSGNTVAKPTTDPTKTGYTFGGWYVDNTFTKSFDFTNTKITASITLYAQFTSTTTQASIVGKWKLTAHTTDGKDTFSSDYKPCEMDNIDTYTADGKFTTDEGATKCNAGDPQTVFTGSYTISSDKKQLNLYVDIGSGSYSIVSLTATTLIFSYISATPIISQYTYTRQ